MKQKQRLGVNKFPPYGKALAERLAFGNYPLHVVVCIGHNAWSRAKAWNSCPNDCPAMVLPPGDKPITYRWPVEGQLVVIDVAIGPTEEQVRDLAHELIRRDAEAVTVYSRDGCHAFRQFMPEHRVVA